ncbi:MULTISPECIES: type II toxin-antitoxin system Phd/YefM family antitoxin [Rickettsieae]|jgi:prevent-host-death family protein|uniref:type II toxin-antitoxin system Phd/YefM family antitoxin n=1 Tax=Rickettsieae TaxID=33988 RepID=UPI000B9B1218|nr:type II toxin-antitoxin system prevent-host-death family antitoxin [Rickettsia endosymbiont of Culicoides newsteadi]OZG32364.1 prevent-host-death family protein [Rickettsia endosymbiont of Culicoides newsteadi]
MYPVNITSAKAHLSSLLKEVEDKNEEVIIERAGKPIAKIIKYNPMKSINRLGIFKDKIKITKDFDKWSEEMATRLGIKD